MMGKRIWAAVVRTNQRTKQGTQTTAENNPAHRWFRVAIDISSRSDGGADPETDDCAEQRVATAAILHPRPRVTSRRMCRLRRTHRTSGELSKLHGFVGMSRNSLGAGVICVLTSSNGDCVSRRRAADFDRPGLCGLCGRVRCQPEKGQQNRHKGKMLWVRHGRMLVSAA
jgi:hypothetical protein